MDEVCHLGTRVVAYPFLHKEKKKAFCFYTSPIWSWELYHHKMLTVLLCLFVAALGLQLRQITCDGTNLPIDPALAKVYQPFFRDFNESNGARQGKPTLMFEALAYLASAASGGVDIGEFMVTVRQLEMAVASPDVPLSKVRTIWRDTWKSLADSIYSNIPSNSVRAKSAYHRAAMYYQLSIRFEELSPLHLDIYNTSVNAFSFAVYPICTRLLIPYTDENTTSYLHAYWCPNSNPTPNPTILAFSGYDGTAEITYHEVAAESLSYGFNVLVFEGPGQGFVARFNKLFFRPDWDFVVSQVIDFLPQIDTAHNIDYSNLVLWGRSFGGYLGPQAFSRERRVKVLVADGGVYDFFQALFCVLPPDLRALFYSDIDAFSSKIQFYRQYSLALEFLLIYGKIGFNADKAGDLFIQLQDYWLNQYISGITGPVLINNPALGMSSHSLLPFTASVLAVFFLRWI